MSDVKNYIKITSDTRKTDGWVKGRGDDGITFSAKIFDKPSKYGIDKGRISKLSICQNNEWIVNFDRGWDVKPAPEHKPIYEAVMKLLNGLSMTNEIGGGKTKTLQNKLEAAKEKAAVREFEINITETSQFTVKVKAKSREEAEEIAVYNLQHGAYFNEPENFRRAKIEAAPDKTEHSRNGDER